MHDTNAGPGTGLETPLGHRYDRIDAELLRELRALNARGVALLRARASCVPKPGADPATPAARSLATDLPGWGTLPPAVADRLAAQPFLLFGIGLEQPARWQPQVRDTDGAVPAEGAAGMPWPEDGPSYARMLCHYAWHLARTAPRTAALVAGMAPETTAVLRACPVERLDVLAQRAAAWLQLRWHDEPQFWSALIAAAQDPEGTDKARVATLRALQRLGSIHVDPSGREPGAGVASAAALQRPTLW